MTLKNSIVTLFNEKKDCCNCGTCVSVCPTNAISMVYDEYGFAYPSINTKKCVQCLQCKNVCSFSQMEKIQTEVQEIYAAYSTSTDKKKSSSGGVFASIAQCVLQNDGFVCGAIMEKTEKTLQVVHKFIHEVNDLELLLGSKYVQSNTGNTYSETKEFLKQGEFVLYSGTPCQIAGLKNFLGKDYSNLLTIDIICHGVPSQQLFSDFIDYQEKKKDVKIVSFEFRNNRITQGFPTMGVKTANGMEQSLVLSADECSYFKMFSDCITLRESCYSCKYARKERIGDFTIGDFWGGEIEHSNFVASSGLCQHPRQGVSCLFMNSVAAKTFIAQHRNILALEESTFEKVAIRNQQLLHPTSKNKHRKQVLEIYKNNGYIGIEHWYQVHYFLRIVRAKVKRLLLKRG